MRYGCCVNMVTRTQNISGTDIVPVLKSLGFDYAELSLSHLCVMSDPKFLRVKSILTDAGLPFEVCNNFFPADIHLTGPLVNQNIIIQYLERAFQRCRALGVQTIVFGSGPARQVPSGFSLSKAMDQLVDLLRLINKYAQEYGITIAIEPLRKQECNIVNTYHEALELERLTNASRVRCLLDLYHLSEENENISVIHRKKNSLEHVHISEPAGRVFPNFNNRIKYYYIFSNLKQAGYDRRISIEAYSGNFTDDAKQSLQLLKEIESELNINSF